MSRSLIQVLAVFLMFTLSVCMYLVWFTAFLSGGEITVAINAAGEMWVEYVLWIFITAIITIGFTDYLNNHSTDND